jgi:abnormal spindle-like microcephaly-associated protein
VLAKANASCVPAAYALLLAPLLQAAYRGHAGRNEYRRRLAVLREKERMQAEREAAARAVITPWARTFVDRGWFLRAGKAVRLLQRWWKRQYRRRQAAAITIQANVRCFLAQRRLQSSRRAALVLQTAWRGAAVRASHPRCKQLADIRLRLAAAAANAGRAGPTFLFLWRLLKPLCATATCPPALLS